MSTDEQFINGASQTGATTVPSVPRQPPGHGQVHSGNLLLLGLQITPVTPGLSPIHYLANTNFVTN
ncbi:hypothetical protein E2C01_026350 [Portunus trituberculatus]|uniref:Uncharacterized protein n=1 Tax=Portunus trituberculatus TaxID=210409 RepID=A0A5B7EFS0_PORTR|nr:hypothetical protein [Portunus trituberculatus]